MAPSSGDHLFTCGAIYLPPHKESVQRGDPKAYPDANQRPATLELNWRRAAADSSGVVWNCPFPGPMMMRQMSDALCQTCAEATDLFYIFDMHQ